MENQMKSLTFAEHAKTVLMIKQYKVRDNTYQLHWESLCRNHILPYFGTLPIDSIKRNDIEMYFILYRDYARETLKSHFSVLNEILDNAYVNDIIPKNPCEHFKIQVGGKKKKKRVYTPEQADLVLAYSKLHRFGLEIDLLLNCGLTRSELLGIKWDDIDHQNQLIYIQRGVTVRQGGSSAESSRVVINDTKNEYRERVIAVSDETMEHINRAPRELLLGRNVHKKTPGHYVYPEFLIYNRFGKVCSPDSWYVRRYKVFMQEMHDYYLKQGVNVPMLTPHELRHTRASIWVNEGKNPYAIAAQLGWSDLDMLSRVYGHRDIQLLRKQLGI